MQFLSVSSMQKNVEGKKETPRGAYSLERKFFRLGMIQLLIQRRGGRGRSASAVKEEDFIEKLLVTNSHDTLLCFSDRGKVYWLRTFQIPIASRAARGRPVVNILPLGEGERITAMLPIEGYGEDQFIFMATANGTVKKTPLIRDCRIALAIKADDRLG